MTKPLLIMDQHFRGLGELFDAQTLSRLRTAYRIEGGEAAPMDHDRLRGLLRDAQVLVASRPWLTREDIDRAPNLRAIIEVSGAFHRELDYDACFDRGIEVLSCAPGFRQAVAEMGLAMILAAGRGLVSEHEAFRKGAERWLADRDQTDFTIYGQPIGFVGYGNISRELHRLLAPFSPRLSYYDPWVGDCPGLTRHETLGDLFANNRVVVVAAAPTSENRHFVGPAEINAMQDGALLVLLSRAHVIDFDAAIDAAAAGKITFATDVYPSEPVPPDHPMRSLGGVIYSPHRAAAVPGGRQLIGRMIEEDLRALQEGRDDRMLQPAHPKTVKALVKAQEAIESDGRLPGT